MAKWLKHWTMDLEVPGSSPLGNRDPSLQVSLSLTPVSERRSYLSFRAAFGPGEAGL